MVTTLIVVGIGLSLMFFIVPLFILILAIVGGQHRSKTA